MKLKSVLLIFLILAANPTLLADLSAAQSKRLATELIKKRPNRKQVKKQKYDYYNKTDVHIYFHSTDVDSIIRQGFLNTHQLDGKTSGGKITWMKEEIENYLLDLSGDHIEEKSLRPKYGVMEFRDDKDSLKTNFNFGPEYLPEGMPKNLFIGTLDSWKYGYYIAVLKDSVKKRATWHADDTMRDYDITEEENQIRQGKNTYSFLDPSAPKPTIGGLYHEVQIWGALTISDVAEIWIPEKDSQFLEKALLKKLTTKKIKVYSYKTEVLGFRTEYDLRLKNKKHQLLNPELEEVKSCRKSI